MCKSNTAKAWVQRPSGLIKMEGCASTIKYIMFYKIFDLICYCIVGINVSAASFKPNCTKLIALANLGDLKLIESYVCRIILNQDSSAISRRRENACVN